VNTIGSDSLGDVYPIIYDEGNIMKVEKGFDGMGLFYEITDRAIFFSELHTSYPAPNGTAEDLQGGSAAG
jgi:hypothetical protein